MNISEKRQLREIGEAALGSVMEMVDNLRAAREANDDQAIEEAETVIHEDPLSIQVRSGWTLLGEEMVAEEFEILLSTGGPATRIIGELDEHKQPINPVLEVQDWFLPWTPHLATAAEKEVLLAYCREFTFE